MHGVRRRLSLVRKDSQSLVIENASVVTPVGVLEQASIKVVDGAIIAVSRDHLNGSLRRLDAEGMYVLPGFIDLHSDAIEKEIEPRTSVYLPINMAITEIDKKLAACGIATMYHSIAYGQEFDGIRNNRFVSEIIREVNRLAPTLGVRTKIHARFEIANAGVVPYLEPVIREGQVSLMSIMDHTPGQGQYKNPRDMLKFFPPSRGMGDAEFEVYVRRMQQEAVPLRTDYVMQLVGLCRSLGIPVASHDDDTVEKLDIVEAMGATITEFPVNMATAEAAMNRGMHILLGAPNVVRGGSTGKNLNAREAIRAGCDGILCSDYVPSAILHAVFTLEREGILPLHRATNMASLNPARAAGIDGFTGSIEPGKIADLVIIDPRRELPKVMKTFVGGREVYSTC
jgi:alpha-D-ribose 1-methylphosphonate 5-triphosphate diphosphatase